MEKLNGLFIIAGVSERFDVPWIHSALGSISVGVRLFAIDMNCQWLGEVFVKSIGLKAAAGY